jgi:hypothetical protein
MSCGYENEDLAQLKASFIEAMMGMAYFQITAR